MTRSICIFKYIPCYLFLILFMLPVIGVINGSWFPSDIYFGISIYIVLGVSFVCNGKIQRQSIFYISCLLAYSLLSISFTKGGWGSVVNFCASVLLLEITTESRFSEFYYSLLQKISLVCLVLVCWKAIVWHYTPNSINPNTFGMLILFMFLYWFSLTDFKKVIYKLLLLLCLILSLCGLEGCSCRSSSITLISFLIINICTRRKYAAVLFRSIIWIFLLLGIFFPLFYLYLYQRGFNIEFFGKSLFTGREGIWFLMLAELKRNLFGCIFGLGSKMEFWVGHNLNMHNNFFAILVNFGLVGVFMYMKFLLFKFKTPLKHLNNTLIRKLILSEICIVFLLGFSEVISIWPPILIYQSLGLGIAFNLAKILETNHDT